MRGLFVHPAQVADIVRRFPEVRKARLIVSGEAARDELWLQVETTDASDGLRVAITNVLRDVTKLRGDVQLVPPGSLPNDGKVIDDVRTYH